MADYTVDADGFIVKTDPYDLGIRTGQAKPRVHYRRGRYNIFGEFEPSSR